MNRPIHEEKVLQQPTNYASKGNYIFYFCPPTLGIDSLTVNLATWSNLMDEYEKRRGLRILLLIGETGKQWRSAKPQIRLGVAKLDPSSVGQVLGRVQA
ncbi:hypothetical protein MMC22_011698 [Lobaria immixta]|nr:hypothetical protein [Lobaria immixta]